MSLFDPTPAEQAALTERLRLLRESAVRGTGVTPAQALDERIAQGDTQAAALKSMIATFRASATVSEKHGAISRATKLEVCKVSFAAKTVKTTAPAFRAKNA